MEREYANVLTRFGAIVIDTMLIVPFYIPIFASSSNLESTDNLGDAYWILFLACFGGAIVFGIWNTIVRMGKTGQSLGRKFLNIAVLDQEGNPIGIGRAAMREIIGRWISGVVCYLGYLNAFWDRDNQMWHDKLANCYVYYVEERFS